MEGSPGKGIFMALYSNIQSRPPIRVKLARIWIFYRGYQLYSAENAVTSCLPKTYEMSKNQALIEPLAFYIPLIGGGIMMGHGIAVALKADRADVFYRPQLFEEPADAKLTAIPWLYQAIPAAQPGTHAASTYAGLQKNRY
jgi:hypothetical protein